MKPTRKWQKKENCSSSLSHLRLSQKETVKWGEWLLWLTGVLTQVCVWALALLSHSASPPSVFSVALLFSSCLEAPPSASFIPPPLYTHPSRSNYYLVNIPFHACCYPSDTPTPPSLLFFTCRTLSFAFGYPDSLLCKLLFKGFKSISLEWT